jgi:hemolysin activation/secretion protein
MRGVPAMRYQGDRVVQMEAELRWQFWNRFSLVGFGGGGKAWNKIEGTEKSQSTVAGGAGFRYEIARKYGIHLGLDAAFGPTAGPTIYIVAGSSWARP